MVPSHLIPREGTTLKDIGFVDAEAGIVHRPNGSGEASPCIASPIYVGTVYKLSTASE